MELAFDISNNNGLVDIPRLKAAGAVVIQVKATEGKTFIDPDFTRNFAAVIALGIVAQPYHFAHPNSDPGTMGGIGEADFFLKVAEAHLAMPNAGRPVLDYESTPDPSFARAWCQRVQGKIGIAPMVYASASRVHELAGDPYLRSLPLWVADYGVLKPPSGLGMSVWMWQFAYRYDVGGHLFDASHVLYNVDSFRMKPAVYYEDISVSGHLWGRIKYGNHRVKNFIKSSRFGQLVVSGREIVLRRQRGN